MLNTVIDWMERGLIPDPALRWGVRRLCGTRLRSLRQAGSGPETVRKFADELRRSPVAVYTQDANAQHYEIPAAFFEAVLGPNLKYSCAYWGPGETDLRGAEEAGLALTCEHADLRDGQNILELGCGWGSLTLYMAEKFPGSKVTAVSNSASQREFIMAQARARGFQNVEVLTHDLGTTKDLGEGHSDFDRVVSVEMFEHLRNYGEFFKIISPWLKPDAKMFVHVFTHREFAYPFETEGDDNWMGRYFFTGGQVPARNLFAQFPDHFVIIKQWEWSGEHYQKTSDAWLANMDRHLPQVREIFLPVYGKDTDRWLQRWRMFFLSVAEFFGYDHGREWGVTHYLFEKKVP